MGIIKRDGTRRNSMSLIFLLFGEAIRLADVVVEAARYGQRLGLGPQRTPFELVSVASVLPLSLRSGLHACTLGDWLPETTSASFHCEYALHYLTPVPPQATWHHPKAQPPAGRLAEPSPAA